MKRKLLISLLTIIMCFSLVGCGNSSNNENDNNENNNQQENDNKNTSSDNAILSKYGLNLSQIKPESDNVKVEATSSENNSEIVFTITDSQFDENKYYEKFYNTIKGVSDDQKIYINDVNFMINGKGTEASFEDVTTINMGSIFGFIYKGKNITANVSSLLDSDDTTKTIMIVFSN